MWVEINSAGLDLSSKFNKTFQKIEKSEQSVVLLHASWCYHCQVFKPEWDKFVSANKGRKGLNIVEIESEALNNLSSHKQLYEKLLGSGKNKLSIGFPTVLLFNGGKRSVYNGERSQTGLEKAVVVKQSGGSKAKHDYQAIAAAAVAAAEGLKMVGLPQGGAPAPVSAPKKKVKVKRAGGADKRQEVARLEKVLLAAIQQHLRNL